MTAAPRIVSLIASSTEIVCELGFESHLVGRSHECDHPASVRELPAVTEPKFDIRLASFAIDERVRGLVQEALSVYRVDAEKLRALAPDLVITQTQCEVCAVSERDVACALEDWIESRPRVVSLTAESLDGVWEDIERVAAALEVPEHGRQTVGALQIQLWALEERTHRMGPEPTVVCIEWIEPLMASGNWVPDLVQAAGGRHLLVEAGAHSPKLDWATLASADPDILVVIPCGFELERTIAEMAAIEHRPEWRALRAVRNGRVALADGNAFFNRPGPRLVESAEILAEILHSDRVAPRHLGRAWRWWGA